MLQPPRSIATTEHRLDAVSELGSSETLLDDMQQTLKTSPHNADAACRGLATACSTGPQSLQTGIQSLLWLRCP